MRFLTTLRIALEALRANIARSLLTTLGIVIGVLSIVLVVSLGQGAESVILSEFESIGATAVIVRPGKQPTNPTNFADTLFSESLVERDLSALKRLENVPNATSVDPAVLVPGSVSYQENIYRPTTFGWTAGALVDIFQIQPDDGVFFSETDIRDSAKVALIGATVKERLFGASDPIGEDIRIKDTNLRVIGTFAPKGQIGPFNVDEVVFIPYTTAQNIMGIDHYHEIFIRADSEDNVDFVVQDVTATIREQHGITDPEKDDFFVTTQQNAIESIGTVTNVLTIFLVAIASISLLVGGIGIMNIMLVSVTERTKEIGLRKAVGATNQDILSQFLIEAVILTVGGGIIGTTLAIAISALVSFVLRTQFAINWSFELPVGAIIIGITVSTAVGMGFGIFPARKAAQKDPIDSLRYE